MVPLYSEVKTRREDWNDMQNFTEWLIQITGLDIDAGLWDQNT